MKRIALMATFSICLILLLVGLENLRSDEPFALDKFLVDILEKVLLVGSVAASALVAFEFRGMRRGQLDLLNDLARARTEGEKWRNEAHEYVAGLSRAIAAKFAEWALSEGEADVASLMLKGLSHKEIARLRSTSEATVRQQAAAVYRKSGLGSRAELAAYFLEDLLAPVTERPATRPPIALPQRGRV